MPGDVQSQPPVPLYSTPLMSRTFSSEMAQTKGGRLSITFVWGPLIKFWGRAQRWQNVMAKFSITDSSTRTLMSHVGVWVTHKLPAPSALRSALLCCADYPNNVCVISTEMKLEQT